MPVIAGNRAEELYVLLLTPGGIPQNAVCISGSHRVEHHVQTGIAADDDFLVGNAQNVGEHTFSFRDAVDQTVVAAVEAVFSLEQILRSQHIHHRHGQIQLFRCRLASGHIELEVLCFEILIFCFVFLLASSQFRFCTCC